jgi:hypothetical protein
LSSILNTLAKYLINIGMRLFQINESEDDGYVSGTNCKNCIFTKDSSTKKVERGELNSQGGLKISDSKDLEKAKEGDLVTLPGKGVMPSQKVLCQHKDISQYVTERMCCAYWDAPGIIRDFGEKVVGK